MTAPPLNATAHNQNTGANPIAAPSAPNSGGMKTCAPKLTVSRMATASAVRPGGEALNASSIDNGMPQPIPSPIMNASGASSHTLLANGISTNAQAGTASASVRMRCSRQHALANGSV